MGDVLPFDVLYRPRRIRGQSFGGASPRPSAASSASAGPQRRDRQHCPARWLRLSGSNALTIDAVDGTNSATGKATGFSPDDRSAASPSTSRSATTDAAAPQPLARRRRDVRLFMSNDNGALKQVVPATRLDLSAFTGNLQLIAQLQKTANAAAGTLSIEDPPSSTAATKQSCSWPPSFALPARQRGGRHAFGCLL
jgi:hypothetical protein